jgi:serpin B
MRPASRRNLALILSFIMVLAACTSGTAAGKSEDLMQGFQAVRPAPGTLPDQSALAAISRFSSELIETSANHPGNVMISPASVYFALAMTLNGADGETKDQMLKALAGPELPVQVINEACRDWMVMLAQSGDKTTLGIADSIWFDQAFSPAQDFLQSNADYFSAGARKLDFRDSSAPNEINRWVKEATRGTIDQIVDSIDPNVVMYLINTVYFKSEWQTPFDPNATRKQTFNTPDGPVEAPFLNRIDAMDFMAGEGAQGVVLPYEDGRFSYFALLPDSQITPRQWIVQQGPGCLMENIKALMEQKQHILMSLTLPKYESRYEDSLKDELSLLGMEMAFDPDRADFSRMNASGEKNLYISEVKHKTYVRVDEKGTEASAATSVEVSVTSMPIYECLLIFDRPFLYGIVDNQTGLPLFLGILDDPSGD